MSFIPLGTTDASKTNPRLKAYRPTKQTRHDLIMQLTESLERGVPEQVIMRKILNTTGYSLAGARNLMIEAKLRADPDRRVVQDRPEDGRLL